MRAAMFPLLLLHSAFLAHAFRNRLGTRMRPPLVEKRAQPMTSAAWLPILVSTRKPFEHCIPLRLKKYLLTPHWHGES
ncbi:hypothetical protein EV126DRAFT_411855 [Verticillium dahliae]|nr:hypothetical protein EV126DRAFT_411855 [Verticillium dahliae]